MLEPEWKAVALCLQTPGGPTPYIESDPGWGKSARFVSLVKRLKAYGLVMAASMHSDPAEANGFGTIDPATGELRFQPSPTIRRFMDAVEGPEAKYKWGVGLIDEITTVPPATTAAFLRLVHEGWAGDLHLPREKFRWALAGNPPETSVGGYETHPALNNRCCWIPLQKPRLEVWERYVMGIDLFEETPVLSAEAFEESLARAKAEWLAFERANPGSFVQPPPEGGELSYPTLRSDEYAYRLLAAAYAVGEATPVKAFQRDEPEEKEEDADGKRALQAPPEGSEVLYVLMRGVVGASKARMFFRWRYTADLPDPEAILANPKSFRHDPSRLDRTYAALNAVAMAAVRKMKSKELARKRRQAAWDVIIEAGENGAKGVSVSAMVTLANGAPDDEPLSEKAVEYINACREMLRGGGYKL